MGTGKPFMRALLLASALWMPLPGATQAQVLAAGSHDFDIGAGPLRRTLSEIGRITGLAVVYDETAAASAPGGAVRGHLTAEAALDSAVAGTGLAWRALDAGSVTIFRPAPAAAAAGTAADGSVVLDEITLTAAPGTQTEGTGSWTTEWMRSATGLVLSQKETPQSTSVITDAQMKDRNISTIAKTMDAATGITVQAYESDRVFYYSRGFEITAFQYDGAPMPNRGGYGFGDNNPDMAIYDHVEIVRGATGLMQGAGQPGASVNFIRKRPTADFQNQAAVSLAWPKGGRIESDVSGPLNDSGSVRGRLISVIDSRDGMLDRYHKDKYVLYGAVDVDLSADTTLNAGISYQKTKADNVTWGGLSPYYTDGGIIDWPWGSTEGTDWSGAETERTDIFASLEHVFQNGWTGRVVLTHTQDDFDAKLAWIEGIPDRDTGLGMTSWARRYAGGQKQNSVNAMLNGEFQAFGRQHQFVLGGMASDTRGTYYAYDVDESTLAPVGNIFDWDGSFPSPAFNREPTSISYENTRQYALYGTAQLRLTDALTVIGGTRVNWWQGDQSATDGSLDTDYSYNGEWTPYLGFTHALGPVWTAYGSATSIYQPALVMDAARQYLPPSYGWNYELGIKGNPLDGAVYVSAAIFHTDQKDVPEFVDYIPEENRAIYRAIPGTTTRGFELEAAGALTGRWNVSAGYTYRISRDDAGAELYTDQPRHSLKLATEYRVAGLLDDRLTVGGAMRWQSATDSMEFVDPDVEAPNVHQGSYAVFDFSASYDVDDRTELTLSVNNLLNKKYYATTGFYDTVVYGDERSAELTLRSSARSATIRFNRAFSSSSCFSRRISSGSSPPYFFLHAKWVDCPIPVFRQISATDVPPSPCFRMNAFCASVNFDAFVVLNPIPSQGNVSRKLQFQTNQFSASRANTAHQYAPVLRETVLIPFVDMVDLAAGWAVGSN